MMNQESGLKISTPPTTPIFHYEFVTKCKLRELLLCDMILNLLQQTWNLLLAPGYREISSAKIYHNMYTRHLFVTHLFPSVSHEVRSIFSTCFA